jgi:hypothetical protein
LEAVAREPWEPIRLRQRHAPLTEFAAQAMRTGLAFAPGARYQYSSMGILLAARIAARS